MRRKMVILLAFICIILAGFVIGVRMKADRVGPEITFGEKDIAYREGMDEEKLLKDVKAVDAVDGDVTDTLTIESVYPVDEQEAIAVYVAKDSKNNITKVKRKLAYKPAKEEEEEPEEEAEPSEAPEPTATPEPSPLPTPSPAENSEALTPTPEATPEPTPIETVEEETPEERAAREEQEALAEEMPPQSPRIYLTDYIIHIGVGESIDRLSYVKEIQDDSDNISELWHYISINGEVDTNVPGTYELSYYVTDLSGNVSNTAVLQVIVE